MFTPETEGPPSEEAIRVLLVEDHQKFAQTLIATLKETGIDVVGWAQTAAEATAHMERSTAVDVILMDYHLPDGDGISAARTLIEGHPQARVILVTAASSDEVLAPALRAGCAGYVSKADRFENLVTAIEIANAGATAISPEVLADLLDTGPGQSGLSSRLAAVAAARNAGLMAPPTP